MAAQLYTFAYDRNFLPPFPAIDIELDRLHGEPHPISLVALVDSGSDGTMVPISLLRQVQARKISKTFIESITGIRQPADIFEVKLTIAGRQIGRLEVVGDRHNRQIILGRDVLNQFIVTLNGLANVVEISS